MILPEPWWRRAGSVPSVFGAVLVPPLGRLTDVQGGQEGGEHFLLPRGEHVHDVLVHVCHGLGAAVRSLQVEPLIVLRYASTHPVEGLLPLTHGFGYDRFGLLPLLRSTPACPALPVGLGRRKWGHAYARGRQPRTAAVPAYRACPPHRHTLPQRECASRQ
jgi:hypothetical protein